MYRGKRFFVLVLGLVCLLGACERTEEGQEVPRITNTPTECPVTTSATEPTMTVAPTDAPKREEFFDENPTGIPMVTQEPVETAAPIEPSPSPTPELIDVPIPTASLGLEQVKVGMDGAFIDNELCRIQAVSLEKGEYYYVLHLSVENRTEKELKFYVGDVYVNRVECCDWDCEVPAGTAIEEEVTLYDVEKYAGVTELSDITEIYMPFEIYDEREAWWDIFEASWEGYWPEPIFRQTIYYYPQGEAQYVPFTYERQPDDVVVVENEELTLSIIGDVYNEDGGYEIKLFLENHTDKRVWYEIEELSLNGFLCQPFYEWSCDLYPRAGTHGVIEYLDYWKDETEGDTITEISFSLSAKSLDYDYWYSDDFTVYLQGEELMQEYVYVPEERDVILYDGPEALLVLTDIKIMQESDEAVGTAIAYLENKTEQTLHIYCKGAKETWSQAGEYPSDTWIEYVDGGKKRKAEVKLLSWEEDLDAEGQWLVYFPVQMTISVEGFTNKQEVVLDETVTVRVSAEEVCIVSDEDKRED